MTAGVSRTSTHDLSGGQWAVVYGFTLCQGPPAWPMRGTNAVKPRSTANSFDLKSRNGLSYVVKPRFVLPPSNDRANVSTYFGLNAWILRATSP